jgi:pimeloyl-ACP methyl ester carboxylesterase
MPSFPGFQTHAATLAVSGDEDIRMVYLDNHLERPAPSLLLLHGLFDNKATWIPLSRELNSCCRLIAPDMVGFGRSSRPLLRQGPAAYRYSPAMQVDCLGQFIARLDAGDLILVGNSLGGGIALRLYLTRPDLAPRIRGLVLIDTASYPQRLPGLVREIGGWLGTLLNTRPGRSMCFRLRLADYLVRRGFRRVFHDPRKIPPALVEEAVAVLHAPHTFYAYQQTCRNLVQPDHLDLARRFGAIACPILILWGWEDRIISPLFALRLQRDILPADLEILDQCGHVPQLECPRETAALIRKWLQKHFSPIPPPTED